MQLRSLWWGIAAFVVYGSLVPLEYRPLPPGEAWARFQQIPFLNLGVGSRADWIANGVLYAPLGFLGTLALLQRGWWRIVAVVLPVALAWALAVAVEYTQLFFPPRTVSLNDLLAEGIGVVVGAVAALVAWSMRARWRPLQAAGSHWLHDHGLALYAAAYLAYSLFPYDLLISGAELADKLASDRWGWWLAGGDGRPLVTAVRLAMEVVLAAPLGAWLAARRPPHGLARLLVVGLAIGLALELAQLLIASGVTQGASVLTRAAGVVAGGWLWVRRADWQPARVRAVIVKAAPWVLPGYLLVLLGVNGWFSHAWGGLTDAAATLADVRWQPFYYHYYTSEAQALLSLTSVAFSYGLIGVWVWARRSPALAAALGAALRCAVVEGGKLFLAGLKPDPTNLGIAALAAAVVTGLADRWARGGRHAAASTHGLESGPGLGPAPGLGAPTAPRPVDGAVPAVPSPSRGSPALWLLAAAALAWQLASTPPLWLPSTLAVLAAAAAIGWRPALAPVLFAVALPLWDLAPWTGRALWDEFDLLLAVGLAVAWARTRPPTSPMPALWTLGFTLLAASLGVSALIGLWTGGAPGAAPDANALAGYHGPFNALRIVKGVLWAALLVGLWRRLDAAGQDPAAGFARGMVLGLAGVVAWVLWERWAFVGLSDWDAAYRVTGPFSAMHRGGAFVECYIAVAMPFAAQAVLSARRVAARVAAGGLLLAGSLAMMLTFSRNGYAALAVAMAAWAVFALRARAGRRPATVLAVAVLVAGVAAAAWPVLRGGYAQERLAQWERDLGVRVAHWQDALAMRDGSWAGALFGAGLGRFPDLHYWQTREPQRAARLRIESGEPAGAGDPPAFLRMGGGALTYLDQIVRIGAAERATLALRLRARTAGQPLTVSACEKWMLTSATCVSASVTAGPQPDTWTAAEAVLDLSPLAASPHARPVKLALHAPSGAAVVDVAGVSLVADDGRELLRNGDFAHGFDGWWLSTDVDPPYHVHSLAVAVLLEQGWVGALAWTLLLAAAAAAGAVAAWGGVAGAAVAVAALAAFGVSASLNTLIDDPRFLLLVLMLAWGCVAAQAAAQGLPLAAAMPPATRKRRRSRRRSGQGPDQERDPETPPAPAAVPAAPR
jgi:VanZ family protein